MPANLTTWPHFSVSSDMNFPFRERLSPPLKTQDRRHSAPIAYSEVARPRGFEPLIFAFGGQHPPAVLDRGKGCCNLGRITESQAGEGPSFSLGDPPERFDKSVVWSA